MQKPKANRRFGGTSGVVMKAMGLFGGMQILVIFCGVVRVKIVAILLGTMGVGLFSIFNNALTMLSTSTQLGLRTSAVREIAACPDETDASGVRAMVIYWGRMLGLFGFAVTLVGAPFLSLYTFGDYSATLAFMCLSVAVGLMSLTSSGQALMQGAKRLKALAHSTIFGVVAGLIVSVPLIWFFNIDSIVAVVMAYAVTAWIGVKIYGLRRQGVSDIPPRQLFKAGMPMLRFGTYMTIAAIANEIVNYIFIVYITRDGGPETVGIYQSGYTVIMRYVGMVFTALGVEYYPRLAACDANPIRQQVFIRHQTVLLMWLLCPLLLVFIPLAPMVMKILYSADFLRAVPYMLAATPGIVLRGYAWCMSFVMLAHGDGRVYMATELVSIAIGLLLNIFGYSFGGMLGLGVSFSLWYLVYALMMTWVNMRRYGGSHSAPVLCVSMGVLTVVTAAALIFLYLNMKM